MDEDVVLTPFLDPLVAVVVDGVTDVTALSVVLLLSFFFPLPALTGVFLSFMFFNSANFLAIIAFFFSAGVSYNGCIESAS